jgi:hypothetical protein
MEVTGILGLLDMESGTKVVPVGTVSLMTTPSSKLVALAFL